MGKKQTIPLRHGLFGTLTLMKPPLATCSAAANFWFCHHPNCTCVSALLCYTFQVVVRSIMLAILGPTLILREQGAVLTPLGRDRSYILLTTPNGEFPHSMKGTQRLNSQTWQMYAELHSNQLVCDSEQIVRFMRTCTGLSQSLKVAPLLT